MKEPKDVAIDLAPTLSYTRQTKVPFKTIRFTTPKIFAVFADGAEDEGEFATASISAPVRDFVPAAGG